MAAMTRALAAAGLRVARFEFGYMAARRAGGGGGPPRADTLIPEFVAAVAALGPGAPLVIGGKSLGGRMASLGVADEVEEPRGSSASAIPSTRRGSRRSCGRRTSKRCAPRR